MRRGVVLCCALLTLAGCGFLERKRSAWTVTHCWDAQRVEGSSNEFDVSVEAILVGEPHHGFLISGRSERCPEQRLRIWSTDRAIADALYRFALRWHESRMESLSHRDPGELPPGLGLRIDSRVAPGRQTDRFHPEVDLKQVRRITIMSEEDTRRFAARFN